MNTEQTKAGVGVSLTLDVPALKQVMRSGIGPASIRMAVVVEQVAAGSAAFRAGVRQGDIIVAVNEQPVAADATPEAVMQLIIGPRGTKVTLAMDRFIGGKTVPVTCVVRRQLTEASCNGPCSTGGCSKGSCSTGGCSQRAGSTKPAAVQRRAHECGRCPDLQCPGCPRIESVS